MERKIDVIIPTYRPDDKFFKLVDMLLKQSLKPGKIIVVNTDEDIWRKSDADERLQKILGDEKDIFVLKHIKKEEFNHGKTRNIGVALSEAEYFVCMTMDAVPKNTLLLENFVKNMSEEVKLCYARQLPNEDADMLEKFTRSFNYPDKDILKSEADREFYGIKIYFCSNVCACYDRKSFDETGGFKEDVILNEDMIYAHDLLKKGKKLKYVSEAEVLHSHSYTGLQQLKRNFDIGVSQKKDAKIFEGLKSESEGIRMVKLCIKYLKDNKKTYLIPKLIYMSACKFIGFRLGKMYDHLPKSAVKALSLNKAYWR